jgi:hypothetical protein
MRVFNFFANFHNICFFIIPLPLSGSGYLLSSVPAKRSYLVKPDVTWKTLLIQAELINGIFDLYNVMRFRLSSNIGHLTQQLLLQLASIHGLIYEDDVNRRHYLSWMLSGWSQVMDNSLFVEFNKRGLGGDPQVKEAIAAEFISMSLLQMRLVQNFELAIFMGLEGYS